MRDTLLLTLGTSPAIVPEAFLMPGADFRAVHVLTTERTELGFVAEWFAEQAPGVELSLTRVVGFDDLRSQDDHRRFEEVLFRWWLRHAPREAPPYACLSGGFKTMSAAMQKAAELFGARELFHVLCNLPQAEQPKDAAGIQTALEGGLLHYIRLGLQPGWPQLAGALPKSFPLRLLESEETVQGISVLRAEAPDAALREFVDEIAERGRNIASAWECLPALPFAQLATWSSAQLAWLREPLDPEADRAWVEALPKIELHCHLGGFATDGESLAKVRAAAACPEALPPLDVPQSPPGWPLPKTPVPLKAYMKLGDAGGSAVLGDPGCLRRHCELLYDHLRRERVAYAEIRCSPANYAKGRSPWEVLGEIKAAFDRCRAEALAELAASPDADKAGAAPLPPPQIQLIVIATRREGGDYRAAISRHLALAVTAAEHWTGEDECRVVGVDLAGYEDASTRAHYFRDEFTGVHRCGLAVTVHAGENDEAEGIWRAVFDLNARRLGHGLRLADSPELLRSVAARGIGIEMCPYANLQIKGYAIPGDGDAPTADAPGPYPLKRYLDEGARVTVNTDNIGISGASLAENLLLAARLCPGMTRLDLLRLLRNALESAFLSPEARNRLARQVEARLPIP